MRATSTACSVPPRRRRSCTGAPAAKEAPIHDVFTCVGTSGADSGFELTSDGFILHPRQAAYWIAAGVGAFLAILTVFVVGAVAQSWLKQSPSSNNYWPTFAVVLITAVAIGGMALVAWFTSLPPTLTVTHDWVSLRRGLFQRRIDRSGIVGINRARQSTKTGSQKVYVVVLKGRRLTNVFVRYFEPDGLEEAMRRLGVPLTGDFTDGSGFISMLIDGAKQEWENGLR